MHTLIMVINSNISSKSNNLYSYVPMNNSIYYPNTISSLSNISVTSNPYISSPNSLQQGSLLNIRESMYNNLGLVNSQYRSSYITTQSIPLLVNTPLPVANSGYYIQGQNIQSIPYNESGINYQNIYSNNYFQNFNGKTSFYNYSQHQQNSSLKYDTKSYELNDDELNTSKELNVDDLYVPEPLNTNPNVNLNVSIPNNNIYQYESQNINPTIQAARLSSASKINNLNYAQNQNQAVLLPNYSSFRSLTNQSIYAQSQNIQSPNIGVLPQRIIRTGVPNILSSPVRMDFRSSSLPVKLRSYPINESNANKSNRIPFSPIKYSINRSLVLSPMRYSNTRPPIGKYNFTSLPIVSIPANQYHFSSVPMVSNPAKRYNIFSAPPMNSPSGKFYITPSSEFSKSSKKNTYISIVSNPLRQIRPSSPHDEIRSPLRQNQFSSPKIIVSPVRENRFLSPHDARSPLRQVIINSPQTIPNPLMQTYTYHVRNITSPLRQSREIEISRIVAPITEQNSYKNKTYKAPTLYKKKNSKKKKFINKHS